MFEMTATAISCVTNIGNRVVWPPRQKLVIRRSQFHQCSLGLGRERQHMALPVSFGSSDGYGRRLLKYQVCVRAADTEGTPSRQTACLAPRPVHGLADGS